MADSEDSIVEAIIHRRKSAMTINRETPIERTIVERLVRAAQAAPNHRKTRPLRCAVVQGDARARLGEAIADAMAAHGDSEVKVEKARTKYLRAPVVIVVASAAGESDLETEENRYAVAAGIQNLLVLAEAIGLTLLWSSPAHGANDAITSFCGFDRSDHVMGLVYLGWPLRESPVVERPEPVVHWID